MDRIGALRGHLTREQLGVEIGPWFSPAMPKRDGFNVLTLDLFDGSELRARAAADPAISPEAIVNIEEVDLIGSATDLERLVRERGLLGRLDYVVSSHNFEHLPDPIRFLQGCERVLRPGGTVAMAIPDRRCCFDYFRGHSLTGDLIAAYFERRERPTAAQIFEQWSFNARWRDGDRELIAFSLDDDRTRIVPLEALDEAFHRWRTRGDMPEPRYRDVHCWKLTPAVFELIARDLRFLGLIELDVADMHGPNGCEFYVRLAKPAAGPTPVAPDVFYARRRELLHRIYAEIGAVEQAGGDGVEIDGLREQVAALQTELGRRNAEIRSLRSSASEWITAPGRTLARILLGRRR